MTEKEAITLYESKFWLSMTSRERAVFQLFEPLLCMPFDVFHEAMEAAIGRPIWTHEFGRGLSGLKKELLGEKFAPTPREIMELLPKGKVCVILHLKV